MNKISAYFQKTLPLMAAFFSLWFSAIAHDDPATIIHYSISRNGKIIGHLKAEKNACSQGQRISLASELKGRLIFEINIVQYSETILNDGFMLASLITQKVNGNTNLQHGLLYKNGAYHSTGDEELEGILPEKIAFSTNLLYFREPAGCKQVYSETLRKMIPLICKGNGIYRLNLTEGKYTEYQYQSGMLVKVISKSNFGEIIFNRAS